MKKLFLVLMLFILSGSLAAGNVQTGIAISYNSSNSVPSNEQYSNMPGFRIGGIVQLPCRMSLLQAEVLLSSKGFSVQSIGDTRLSNLFLYLELPLSIKHEFLLSEKWNIVLFGGFSARTKIIAINLVSEIEGIRMFDAGVHVGTGVRFHKIEFDVRYDQSIINFDMMEPAKFHNTLSLGMNFYFRDE